MLTVINSLTSSVNAFGDVTITIAIARVHLVQLDLELGGHWPSDQDNQPVL